METPLRRSDLYEIFKGKVKILTYPELLKIQTIDDLFAGSYGNVIINYLTSEQYGHWVAIKKRGKLISFFDSYGLKPDEQLTKIDMQTRRQLHEIQNRLLYFIQSSYKQYTYEYNEKRYQKDGRETCGHWCVLFLKKRGGVDEFQEYIESQNAWDLYDFVYYITTRNFF